LSVVDVQLREITADDEPSVAAYVAVDDATRLVDGPWWPQLTAFRQTHAMRHGFGGEPGRYFLVESGGEVVGRLGVHLPMRDNLDQSWVELGVHPDHRRRGIGSTAMDLAGDLIRDLGRVKTGWFGWDGEQTRGFAAARGSEVKSVAVCRRQHLHELEPGLADELYAEALPHAAGYELVRVPGRMPEDLLTPFLEAAAAINDAPRDALEFEDEVFSPERNREFEDAQEAGRFRLYRILARVVGSDELAGVTSVSVDGETSTHGHQLDTSVVRSHRGHRLGLLLKADMMRWLAGEEPGLRYLDTFNAESNDHMVGVNERLGYRVMARELQYQDEL
jgi:RimJ/RimL family protein N-acetyltransferase